MVGKQGQEGPLNYSSLKTQIARIVETKDQQKRKITQLQDEPPRNDFSSETTQAYVALSKVARNNLFRDHSPISIIRKPENQYEGSIL
jgi:hypothetical protein